MLYLWIHTQPPQLHAPNTQQLPQTFISCTAAAVCNSYSTPGLQLNQGVILAATAATLAAASSRCCPRGLYSALRRSFLLGTPSLGCVVCVAATAARALSCSYGYTWICVQRQSASSRQQYENVQVNLSVLRARQADKICKTCRQRMPLHAVVAVFLCTSPDFLALVQLEPPGPCSNMQLPKPATEPSALALLSRCRLKAITQHLP